MSTVRFDALVLFSFLIALLYSSVLSAQQLRYYDVWQLQGWHGIDFRSGSPVLVKGGIVGLEGNASICDPATGELLFYTNGEMVWNRDHEEMSNGGGLIGGISSSQSSLIVPHPGDSTLFYLFTMSGRTGGRYPSGLLHYSVIDMDGDGGLGAVTEKNVELWDDTGEQIVGICHKDGIGFWVVVLGWKTDCFQSWLVTADGLVEEPVISVVEFDGQKTLGYLKASPNGEMLVAPVNGFGNLYRFDAAVGKVGEMVAQLPSTYSSSFSPDNNFFYAFDTSALGDKLVQYDLRTLNEPEISSTVIVESPPYTMQIAPDGKIYMVSSPMSVIEYPNLPGKACGYRDSVVLLNNYSYGGLPNNIDGFLGECGTCVNKPPPSEDSLLLNEDTTICQGDLLQLQVAGKPSTLVWTPSEGLSCDDCPDPIAAPETTTTYYLSATFNDGCSLDTSLVDSVTVTVEQTEAAITLSDSAICPGQEVTLRASGGTTYRWTSTGNLDCFDCQELQVRPKETTTYILQATVEGRCASYDTVKVIVHDQPDVVISPDTTLCVGASVELSALGGVRYAWQPSGTLDCDSCSNPVASPLETTTYRVVVTSEHGCQAVDSVTVSVLSAGDLKVSSDTAFCRGGTAQLRAEGAEQYTWSPATSLSCAGCPNPIAEPSETTTYYVVGRNKEGECPALDSVVVTVYPSPVADAGEDILICFGERIRLQAEGGVRYEWDVSPDLSCQDCADPLVFPKETTTYYVTAYNEEGCQARDSVQVEVHPELGLSAGEDLSICRGDSVKLQAKGGVRWEWSPSEGLSCTDCPDPVATPTRSVTYRVTAWSTEGCAATDDVTVRVEQARDIRLRISRELGGQSGERLMIPVELVDGIGSSNISELSFTLEYDPAIMVINAGSIEELLAGRLLEGWDVAVLEDERGKLLVRLSAPVGTVLSGVGELLRVESRLYLSGEPGTELRFEMGSSSRCFTFVAELGYAELDSICGLNFRLIEVNAAKYVPPAVYPNPASDQVTFEFGIGLDGPVSLILYDLQGREQALIVDEIMKAGYYHVEWDASQMPAGIYRYRLVSGDWHRNGEVVIRP